VNFAAIRERALLSLLRWAPKETFSDVMGFAARRVLPRALRAPTFTAFARAVGADLDEVELPLAEYASLDAFFTRGLKPGARPMPEAPEALASPCDGAVSATGSAAEGTLIQAKGIDYQVADLLDDAEAAAKFAGGTYITIYLSPRDYHRVHYMLDGRVTGFHHVPGRMFPVNRFAVARVPQLFSQNERLVTYMDTSVGTVAVVMVAATGVGHISVTYDDVETRRPGKGQPGGAVRLDRPVEVRRGQEMGCFHLGSTVVALFQKDRVALEAWDGDQPVRLGQVLGRKRAATAQAA